MRHRGVSIGDVRRVEARRTERSVANPDPGDARVQRGAKLQQMSEALRAHGVRPPPPSPETVADRGCRLAQAKEVLVDATQRLDDRIHAPRLPFPSFIGFSTTPANPEAVLRANLSRVASAAAMVKVARFALNHERNRLDG